jgi:hypothetical protein
MRKLVLWKGGDPTSAANFNSIMTSFKSGTFDPNHLAARFSNVSLSDQRGYYQRLNGIVFVHIEICPDINNPLGGGATVSFNSGDVLTAPFPCIAPQTYAAGNWIGQDSLTMTKLSDGTKYTNIKVRTNNTTGDPEILISHTIAATASTFLIEGFYITKV